jgi:receptor protein-tyrosine kinase
MNATTPAQLTTSGSSRSIGDILVASGRISADDLRQILSRQRQDHVPFGEAAIALHLLTKEDINFALSKQFDYAYLTPHDSSLSPSLVAAYTPFSRVGENLRAVRSQLMLRWFNGDPMRKVLAVVSPGVKDGRSFIAANLAIVFAQQGERTLLIDADLRANPDSGQQSLFKLPRGNGLSGVLAERAGLDAIQLVPGLPGLAVLASGAMPPNPQELLGRPTFGQLLLSVVDEFDVILVDTPNGSHFADAEIIAARTGAAIMVGRVNKSSVPETSLLARRLQEGGVTLVGSVLNDF